MSNATQGKAPFAVLLTLIFIAGIFSGVIIDRKFPPKAEAANLNSRGGNNTPQIAIGNSDSTVADSPLSQLNARDTAGDNAKNRRSALAKKAFIKRMGKKLSLSPQQQNELTDIVARNEPEFLSIRERFKSDFNQFQSKIETQIVGMLDDKQKKDFKKDNTLLWRYMRTGETAKTQPQKQPAQKSK